MTKSAHFSVDTRLTRILGANYRSSELALKELVDNAWDADASLVAITLPEIFSEEPIVIEDNGTGMTPEQVRSEYLKLASDKVARMGSRTSKGRKVKGRKGIGKLAGLSLAFKMDLETCSTGMLTNLTIDRRIMTDGADELNKIDLPFEAKKTSKKSGTKVTLREMNQSLKPPIAEKLRELIVQEYARSGGITIVVNGNKVGLEDLPGQLFEIKATLPHAGEIELRFSIMSGRSRSRHPGVVFKVDGKVVGAPNLLGLDSDTELPGEMWRRFTGEVDVSALEEFVTSDWGSFTESSVSFQEVVDFCRKFIREKLVESNRNEITLHKARAAKALREKLGSIPEYKRAVVQEQLDRILSKYNPDKSYKGSDIADVALDAMDFDDYYSIIKILASYDPGDINSISKTLSDFGLLEISKLAMQARGRMAVLDHIENLSRTETTTEAAIHKALEHNMWIFGRAYSLISSNSTLRSLSLKLKKQYEGSNQDDRPDLVVYAEPRDSFVIVEFKRPSIFISRDHISQAQSYKDEMLRLKPNSRVEVLVVGRGLAATIQNVDTHSVKVLSYLALVSEARSDLEWLLRSLDFDAGIDDAGSRNAA